MASSWIVTRLTNHGQKRYRVVFRVGGAESSHRYAGSFPTKAEAIARKRWVDGELANMRVPDLRAFGAPSQVVMLRILPSVGARPALTCRTAPPRRTA